MKIIEHSDRVITGYFYTFFKRPCFPKGPFSGEGIVLTCSFSLCINCDANSLATRFFRDLSMATMEKFELQGCFNTSLEHTPKPLPTGYRGIHFIVG